MQNNYRENIIDSSAHAEIYHLDNYTLSHIFKREKDLFNNKSQQKEILLNKLIYPEERSIQKPLSAWAKELIVNLQTIATQKIKHSYATKIAQIYHQAAFIFLALGYIKAAKEICYTQIQLFIMWGKRSGNIELINHVIQPWINLSRIDCMEDRWQDAINKLNVLTLASTNELDKNTSLITPLYPIFHHDSDVNSLIEDSILLEPTKIYLHAHQYTKLIQLIDSKQFKLAKEHLIVEEAFAIALANTGDIDKTHQVLKQAKAFSHPQTKHVFDLRECELLLSINQPHGITARLLALLQLTFHLLNTDVIQVNDIVFGLHVVHVLHQAGLTEDAAKLGYFCLEAAESVKDDVLKAESLILLYQLLFNTKGQKIIENMLVEHYFHTQYVTARQKMLAIFADLQHVETSQDNYVIESLFEELLSF